MTEANDEPPIARELRKAARRVAETERDAIDAVEDRDRLVRKAVRDRWTLTQVAEWTGLSRQRIGQILRK